MPYEGGSVVRWGAEGVGGAPSRAAVRVAGGIPNPASKILKIKTHWKRSTPLTL